MTSISLKRFYKMLIVSMMLIGFSFAANAQSAKKTGHAKKMAKMEQAQLKGHVCTQACHDKGKHEYAHGEKGHVCTDECKKPESMKHNKKDHVCIQACHDSGKHVYAHGEKGHVCTDECKKKK